jgi:hypothetical protein
MAGQVSAGAPNDTWTAAIHVTADDFSPLGTGLVIDERRILTCAHVVVRGDRRHDPLWVAFPKAGGAWNVRRRARVILPKIYNNVVDVAVLVLEDVAPPNVTAAPLRCPAPGDLVGRPWWAFGFSNADPLGSEANGTVGAHLGYGWVRLDTTSTYRVEQGFSGAGLWSPDYAAVVGVVGQANLQGDNRGDGRALTLQQADMWLPEEKLRVLASWSVDAAGEGALSAWGWTLEADPEAGRHWRPRARGVSVDSERGYRFRGRTAALRAVVAWLDRPMPDRRVLVITGSTGVGKSAVLGRVVTTADPWIRATLPHDDKAVRASERSVACAVHAKGKTALEVAVEISRAASTGLPEQVEDLAPALRETLTERPDRPFNLIVDALDEATSPEQARAIVSGIVLPIAQTCGDLGAQVVVGTRRRDDGGDLLAAFAGGAAVVDLDADEYFHPEDLVAYALASLRLVGDERPGNPYADPEAAGPVAQRIAELAGKNFLIAGLVARSHGLHDDQAVKTAELALVPTVGAALDSYLSRLAPVGQVSARTALTALAFAEAPGLSVHLWQVAVGGLDTPVAEPDLARFARSSAANFLIESTNAGANRAFRLFHQALNDALLAARADVISRPTDERVLTQRFLSHGRTHGWATADPYLLRSLPTHADRAGMIDELLTDNDYLLNADLRRLIPLADNAESEHARSRAKLLRLTPQAIVAAAPTRAALFSVTAAVDNLGEGFAGGRETPYQARWAAVVPRSERTVLEGHIGRVRGVCAVSVGGRRLLASAGDDATVRIWDPGTGEERGRLKGHIGPVYGVCAVSVGGRRLLASAGDDATVRIWDPGPGEERGRLKGHIGAVMGVCAVRVGGLLLVASAGAD